MTIDATTPRSHDTTASYGRHFYEYVDDTATTSAAVVVPLTLELLRAESVVDVGCGTGAWLEVFREHGIVDVLGIDDERVPADLRQIPSEQFVALDLTDPSTMDRSFSLAVSLEVAEHLPPESADRFVDFLCSLAPVVLFSAAIPGQGGEDHLNEQWPAYWADRFAARGFAALDVMRPVLWEDERVSSFYRQNLIVYVREDERDRVTVPERLSVLPTPPLPLVHPATWIDHLERVARWRATPLSFSAHVRALPSATKRALGRRLPFGR